MLVEPEQHRIRGGSLLILSFLKRLKSWNENGITFNEICTIAYRDDGCRLCEKLGMLHIGEHKYGKIYWNYINDMGNYAIMGPSYGT